MALLLKFYEEVKGNTADLRYVSDVWLPEVSKNFVRFILLFTEIFLHGYNI